MTTQPTEQPRILFVTYVMPWWPRYGGALRCFGVIRGLAERCDLHVVLASSTAGEVEAFRAWPAPSNVTRHTLSPDPGWEGVDDRLASRNVRVALGRGKYHVALQQLAQTLQPDIVWYFEVEALRRVTLLHHIPVVLDHCDVRWRKQMRLAKLEAGVRRGPALLKTALLRIDDVQLTLRVRHSLVASPDEVSLLWPARAVSVLPNGFDFPVTAPPGPPDSQRLLFYGSLFYKPNSDGIRWMCQTVWPLIRARRPDAQLDVVGLGREALVNLAETPGVTFHGFVDDLDAMIRQAAALVVPLRVGGGTRIKILEAWAKGLPVVSTTIGAEGLAARDGETLLLGDTAEAFADRCTAILANPELRQRLAAAGYEHGRSRFDWPIANAAITAVLRKCLDPTRME